MKSINIFIFLLLFPIYNFSQDTLPMVPILQHHEDIKIQELRKLNSRYRETNLNITPDGKYLFYMSSRGGQEWTFGSRFAFGKREYDGDIWYTKKADGEWQKPVCLQPPINTSSGEDEPNVSPGGTKVYFQSWKYNWHKDGGPYYVAEMKGADWSDPKPLGSGINEFFSQERLKTVELATDGVTLNPEQNLFIVAYGRDYDGFMDLYISHKGVNGKWSLLQPMKINTPMDERSVFLAGDGHTLFFASSGYGGYGGLDIFKTEIDEYGNHGKIYNIGAPFNTEQDDYGFILTADGSDAYFVREGNIHYADLGKANDTLKPKPVKIISGIVKDACDEIPEAKIVLKKTGSFIEYASGTNNPLNGEFSLVSKTTKGKAELIVSTDDGRRKKRIINLGTKGIYEEIVLEVTLPCKVSTPPEKPNINQRQFIVFFDYDKSFLRKESKHTIDNNVNGLDTAQIVKIEITGHTDSHGTNTYNLKLGKRRANAIASYLIKKFNIPEQKFSSKMSFGEEKPISDNKTDQGRQKNRRVEVLIQFKQKK